MSLLHKRLRSLWPVESGVAILLLRVVRMLVSQKKLPVGRSAAGNHLWVAE